MQQRLTIDDRFGIPDIQKQPVGERQQTFCREICRHFVSLIIQDYVNTVFMRFR